MSVAHEHPLAERNASAGSFALARVAIALLAIATCSVACGDRKPARSARSESGEVFDYVVRCDARLQTLFIAVAVPAGPARLMRVHAEAMPFLDAALLETIPRRPVALSIGPLGYQVPELARRTRLSYRFRIAQAAAGLRTDDRVRLLDQMVEATPGSFLLSPAHAEAAARYRVRMELAPPIRFASGMPRDARDGAYTGALSDLRAAPYSVFGDLETAQLATRSGRARLVSPTLAPSRLRATSRAMHTWASRATATTTAYFGQPLPFEPAIIVVPRPGRSVGFGRAMAGSGGAVLVDVGTEVSDRSLDSDWVLTHELVHLALPSVGSHHRWFEEGVATYVEPIARARGGLWSEAELWQHFVSNMGHAIDDDGKTGAFDDTPTWGHIYWGGALFFLLADVEIRQATTNRRGVRDALQGIVRSGASGEDRWPIERALRVGDRATGTRVLERLYERLGQGRERVDIQALFRKLGVEPHGTQASLRDDAPLARARMLTTRERAAP